LDSSSAPICESSHVIILTSPSSGHVLFKPCGSSTDGALTDGSESDINWFQQLEEGFKKEADLIRL